MAQKISDRHIKAWEKFNAELDAYRTDYGDEFAWLYEDACTERKVKDFKMHKNGVLTWTEEEHELVKGEFGWTWSYVPRKNREVMMDEYEAKDYLKFWRACFRRAKKYNAMPIETLEAIQEGDREDIEIDD